MFRLLIFAILLLWLPESTDARWAAGGSRDTKNSAYTTGISDKVNQVTGELYSTNKRFNYSELIISRDQGNSANRVQIFYDSSMVAIAEKNQITQVLVPPGLHYLIFDALGELKAVQGSFLPGEKYCVRISLIDAYMAQVFRLEPIPCDSISKMQLPSVYYIPNQNNSKMTQHMFNRSTQQIDQTVEYNFFKNTLDIRIPQE